MRDLLKAAIVAAAILAALAVSGCGPETPTPKEKPPMTTPQAAQPKHPGPDDPDCIIYWPIIGGKHAVLILKAAPWVEGKERDGYVVMISVNSEEWPPGSVITELPWRFAQARGGKCCNVPYF